MNLYKYLYLYMQQYLYILLFWLVEMEFIFTWIHLPDVFIDQFIYGS